MARLVFSLNLIQKPKLVRVLHHAMAGVAIVAVAYESYHVPMRRKGAYFTIVELPLGRTDDSQLEAQVYHLPLPSPARKGGVPQGITSLALVNSVEGDTVYVVLQCVESLSEDGRKGDGNVRDCYVYRRAAQTNENGVGGGEVVSYERMPRAVDVGGRVWTAACGVPAVENAVFTPSPGLSTSAGSALWKPRPLIVAASGGGVCDPAGRPRGNAVQWLRIVGPTRVECELTVALPALSGFEVGAVVPMPAAAGGRVLLVCHHAVVEVDGGGGGGDGETGGLRRSWRWSPHNRLTACCARDAFLFAATEEGDVVVWDLRRREPRATADDAARVNPAEGAPNGIKVAITGIYAPHAMACLTCALDGAVVYWTRKTEGGAWERVQAHRQGVSGLSNRGCGNNEAGAAGGGLEPAPNTSGCVAMAGDANLAAVVREMGELEVYWCP